MKHAGQAQIYAFPDRITWRATMEQRPTKDERKQTTQPGQPDEYRLRKEARKANNFHALVLRIADLADLSEWQAQQAAVSTLCIIEHRLQPPEARQLNAQLPEILRELLRECGQLPPPRDIDKISLLQMVSRSLDCEEWESEPIVRAVLTAIREKVSAGEYADVAAQLPRALAELWMSADSGHLEAETPPEAFEKRERADAAHDITSSSRQSEPARVRGINEPLPGIGAESKENEMHASDPFPETTDSRGRP
jgi:uncharacterized protein (DUF2267 family)